MAQISMTLQYESEICTQTAAFEAGLGSCLSQAFDRQTLLPAPAPPTQHVSSSAIIWSKLHQILMLQTTGIVQTTVTLSHGLPHIHPANQTCYPY